MLIDVGLELSNGELVEVSVPHGDVSGLLYRDGFYSDLDAGVGLAVALDLPLTSLNSEDSDRRNYQLFGSVGLPGGLGPGGTFSQTMDPDEKIQEGDWTDAWRVQVVGATR